MHWENNAKVNMGTFHPFSMSWYHTTCVNVTSFMPVWKVHPSLRWFSQNSQMIHSTLCRPYTEFHWNWTINVLSTNKFFIPQTKVGLALCWFSQTGYHSVNFCRHFLSWILFNLDKNCRENVKKFQPLSNAEVKNQWSLYLHSLCLHGVCI